ncbi:transcriptional regulator/antitoxin, MazE [Ignisphaera aggregans DSM 17230]|uniref:Transcriptional regulator/antitoxin, MazE n=1 Tax=Ignisphaera aggregans (strain DSM 17230 / JCM 13409 / AQ1.S1) TaxID=583356 RepID=E0SSX8_IGNAA|nr:transcriptional regulator/antitoxin, MazE [Ignisphaera aggregans DSM 17230]
MSLTIKTRVGRKNTIYIPKAIAEAVGLREGDIVTISVKNGKIVIEVIPNPFDLALRGSKFAETTFEEFERESEEMQSELFKE